MSVKKDFFSLIFSERKSLSFKESNVLREKNSRFFGAVILLHPG